MSTKIYNGYRLRQGYSIFDFRAKFAAVMQDEVKRAKLNKMTSESILFMDEVDFKEKTSTKTLRKYLKLMHEPSLTVKTRRDTSVMAKNAFNCVYYNERVVKFSKKEDPFEPQNDCSVTVVHNSIRNETYLLFYGARNLEAIFGTFPEVEAFPYWDNSDHPDDMTYEQWKDRGKAWEESVDLCRSMSSQGFLVNPFDSYSQSVSLSEYKAYLTSSKEIFFPTVEDRLSIMVRRVLIDEYAGNVKAEGGQLMLGDMSAYFRDVANVKRIENIVAPKLREITSEEYIMYLTAG